MTKIVLTPHDTSTHILQIEGIFGIPPLESPMTSHFLKSIQGGKVTKNAFLDLVVLPGQIQQ